MFIKMMRTIRKEIDAVLDRPLSDSEWNDLEEERYVAGVEDGGMTVAEVASRVRKCRRVYGEASHDRRIVDYKHTRHSLARFDELYAKDPRVRALSQAVAHYVAGNDEMVRRFWKEVLGDQLLSEKRAAQWIIRQSNRKVKPGRPNIRIYGTGTASLRRLDALCRDLADVYAWTEVEAERFVLTGSVPLVRPLWVQTACRSVPALSRLVLTVDPMVPPPEVAAFYRRVRRMFHSRRTRRLSEKHAELAAFVRDRPQTERWAETMGRWNATRQKSERYDHVSNFRRDCGRAIKRLLGHAVLPARRHSSH